MKDPVPPEGMAPLNIDGSPDAQKVWLDPTTLDVINGVILMVTELLVSLHGPAVTTLLKSVVAAIIPGE